MARAPAGEDPGPFAAVFCAVCAAPPPPPNPPRAAIPIAPAASAPPTPLPPDAAPPDQAKNRIMAGIATAASARTISPVSRVLTSWPSPINPKPIT